MSYEAKLWFQNIGHSEPRHNLKKLRLGIKNGLLNIQEESGYTALMWSCFTDWTDAIDVLIASGADLELRDFRTGSTALYSAVIDKQDHIVQLLTNAGADPDAPNYWGVTPRDWTPARFEHIPQCKRPLPPPRIQNTEHLADQHYPNFKIPTRRERESLKPGQAVDLYVYGPKQQGKQDTVKVRITTRDLRTGSIRYAGAVETPIEKTHLNDGTTVLQFGPENVATVYIPKAPGAPRKEKAIARSLSQSTIRNDPRTVPGNLRRTRVSTPRS